VDWSSDWPVFEAEKGYLVLIRHMSYDGTFRAYLYSAGEALAVLSQHSGNLSPVEYATVTTAEELSALVTQAVKRGGDNENLCDFLEGYGVSGDYRGTGDSLLQAVTDLLAKLNPDISQYVLNRDIVN
jgi:hypothetical protein